MPPAGVSPAPPATTTPGRRPKRRARSGRTSPVRSVPSTSLGRRDRRRPTAAIASVVPVAPGLVEKPGARRVGNVGRAFPGQPEPEEVLGEEERGRLAERGRLVAGQPEELRGREAGHGRHAHPSGEVDPERLQLARLRPARPSFQRMAGRIGRSEGPRSSAACIWPERPTASTPAISRGCSAESRPRAASTARHQSSGSCSDASGPGRLVASGSLARARTAWSSSTTTTLTADVPRSIPRKRLMRLRPPGPAVRPGSPASRRSGSRRTRPGGWPGEWTAPADRPGAGRWSGRP